MVSGKDILRYVDTLVTAFQPERVVLFGSHARGTPRDDSDVDLLVIMEHDQRKDVEQAVVIDIRLPRKFSLDLIVRRPAEVKRRLALGDTFLGTILGEGRTLYERRARRVA